MQLTANWWSHILDANHSQAQRGPAPSVPAQAQLIKYYDERGRKRFANRTEWCRSVLPRQLARFQDDPKQLYRVIACAVEHGFPQDVLSAAERLVEIEPRPVEHHAMKARVLIDSGLHDRAAQTLRAFAEQRGQHASIMTQQAALHAARGEATASENAIKVALSLDANHADALEFWRKHCESQHGDDGHIIAWEEAAALPGSWRARLMLANVRLSDDPQGALAEYREMLPSLAGNREAVQMIASDLRQARLFEELLELVQPIYEPAFHGAQTGLHLLAACVRARDPALGKMILHSMFMLHRHELRHELQSYANQFMILEHDAAADMDAAEFADQNETFVLMEDG